MAPLLSSRLRWHFLGRSGSLPFVLDKLTRGHPVGTRWMRKYARVYVWPCVYECLNFSISVKRTLFLILTLLFPARTLHTNHSGPFRKSKMSHKSLARGSVCRAFCCFTSWLWDNNAGKEERKRRKQESKWMWTFTFNPCARNWFFDFYTNDACCTVCACMKNNWRKRRLCVTAQAAVKYNWCPFPPVFEWQEEKKNVCMRVCPSVNWLCVLLGK